MSQPGNFRYESYDQTGSLKSGIPQMVNGQPSVVQHTQNGVQPPSLNSAGTPSSQSSRDPSRETSRDPSPTQYLHTQYRPQLSRPPLPPINGQQPLMSQSSMSQQPRPIQVSQSSPRSNPQNASNQFPNVQASNPSLPLQKQQQTSSSSSQGLSSDSQIVGTSQSQKSVTPTKYTYPSPERDAPMKSGSQTVAESQVGQSPVSNSGQSAVGPNTTWNKEQNSSILNSSSNQSLQMSRPVEGWKNSNVELTSADSRTTLQTHSAQNTMQTQSSVTSGNWNKQGSPSLASNSGNQSASTLVSTNRTWTSSSGEINSNDSQTTSQNYTSMSHQKSGAPPRTQPPLTQNPSFSQPTVNPMIAPPGTLYSQQSSGNKINPTSVGPNVRVPPSMGTSGMLGANTNMQSVFGYPPSGQASGSLNQNLSGPPPLQPPPLSKPQAQYPISEDKSNPSISGTTNPNQNTYGSQQNVASQWKYPQPGYSTQLATGSPNIGRPPLSTSNMSGIPPTSSGPTLVRPPLPPTSSGQVPVRPPPSIGQVPIGPPPTMSGQVPIAPPPTLSGQMPVRPPPPTSMGGPPLPGQQPEAPYDYRSPFGQMSNVPLDNMNKRYPTTAYPDQSNQLNAQMGNLNVTQSGFNKLWGQHSVDLLQCRMILPDEKVEPPPIKLHQEFLDSVNCSPEIFRCTLTKIPESNSLLQKCRLPLGVLIHPFKDLNYLPVIQCSTIVRCRACRTYINPFVYFVDSKRWKCNLCYRVNELPEEFQFDPVTKSYGDPSRRPEVKTSTIEFIAPSEYMLRPPQPAVYLFVLDVSRLAVDSGYLSVACETIGEELTKLPGDGRTQVGFIAVDSAVHFFSIPENVSQPHELIMLDVDDVFLPCPDNLIVNLKEREELIRDLLEQLPVKFQGSHDTNNALGAGLQAAFKLMSPTGGRITVFQTCLPNLGPGALQPREDPNTRASKDVPHLNPATDFYKRLALDCSGQQIAVDLFLLNSQYSDLATLSGMCKFSGGCIYHIPLFRKNKPQHSEILEKMLRRYLTRKIGFEAVMRIRCTRGLSIHTFHGNFFVRSTDLLSLPNVNPDAGFGMQVSIEENLSDVQSICFQAALLYTSSKGERRIRVHTLCLPVSSSMTDILFSADQQAIVGLLSKMAVDRSQQSSLSDARDALINVAIDVLSAYKLSQSSLAGGLIAPGNLKLLPLYIIALIKSMSFRSGTSTRLDDRVYSMCQMKALPLGQLMQIVYPDLYPVHELHDHNAKDIDGRVCPQPSRLHLSAENLDFHGVFLMDAGDRIFIYVGKSVNPIFCSNVLGVPAYSAIPEEIYDLPELETKQSERLRNFVFSLQEEKPYYAPVQIIRDDSHFRSLFIERLIEDRCENALSYYEFLQHLKTQVK